jgi:hypoxanthine-DNA glycosylase
MIETHPFDIFIPLNASYLLLGSFIGKQAIQGYAEYDPSYDWYYGTKRNQFWPILEEVYAVELKSKAQKQALFARLGMAIGDIILQCERKNSSNLDANLTVIQYNIEPISQALEKNEIGKVFFTSRNVEKMFRKVFKERIIRFPAVELIALPSPSPRHATMTRQQKIDSYKVLLPKL